MYRVVSATDDPKDGYFILDDQGNNCVGRLIQQYIPEAYDAKLIVLSKFTAEVLVRRANREPPSV